MVVASVMVDAGRHQGTHWRAAGRHSSHLDECRQASTIKNDLASEWKADFLALSNCCHAVGSAAHWNCTPFRSARLAWRLRQGLIQIAARNHPNCRATCAPTSRARAWGKRHRWAALGAGGHLPRQRGRESRLPAVQGAATAYPDDDGIRLMLCWEAYGKIERALRCYL